MEMQGITRGEQKWEDGCRLVKRKRQKTSARGSGRRVRDGILIAREDEEGWEAVAERQVDEVIAAAAEGVLQKGQRRFTVIRAKWAPAV